MYRYWIRFGSASLRYVFQGILEFSRWYASRILSPECCCCRRAAATIYVLFFVHLIWWLSAFSGGIFCLGRAFSVIRGSSAWRSRLKVDDIYRHIIYLLMLGIIAVTFLAIIVEFRLYVFCWNILWCTVATFRWFLRRLAAIGIIFGQRNYTRCVSFQRL